MGRRLVLSAIILAWRGLFVAGSPVPDWVLPRGIRYAAENGFSAIVPAAGPRAIPRLAGIGAVDAQLVSVVGIGRVVPGAVVEVLVLVGDLGAA